LYCIILIIQPKLSVVLNLNKSLAQTIKWSLSQECTFIKHMIFLPKKGHLVVAMILFFFMRQHTKNRIWHFFQRRSLYTVCVLQCTSGLVWNVLYLYVVYSWITGGFQLSCIIRLSRCDDASDPLTYMTNWLERYCFFTSILSWIVLIIESPCASHDGTVSIVWFKRCIIVFMLL